MQSVCLSWVVIDIAEVERNHHLLSNIRKIALAASKFNTRYRTAENFHWTKISPNPATLCIHVPLHHSRIYFRLYGKDHDRFYDIVIINTGQNICGIKILLVRAGGENLKVKNFWLYRI